MLNGTPTQPDALLTPTELQFGPTLVGAAPGEMTFQLETSVKDRSTLQKSSSPPT
ncbi:MAG: hypothetical protein GY822_28985 [Deltaproteobacteria bacterium]|nr:hypothetical protein [Deltaproteobacteria bacterium]